MRRLGYLGTVAAMALAGAAVPAQAKSGGPGAWGGGTHMGPPGGGMHMPRPGGGMHGGMPGHGGRGHGGNWNGGHWAGGGSFGGWRGNGIGGWSGGGWNGGGRGGWDRYYRPARGYRLSSFWLSPTYFISDWGNYGLGAPGYGNRWVRYYDDAVMVDERGNIIDARYGLDWDGPRNDRAPGAGPRLDYDIGYDEGYDDGFSDAAEDAAPRLGHGGPDGGRYGFSNGSVIYAAPGVTTVVVQSAPVVTTTTTTYEDAPYHRVKPKWRPSHRWTAKKPRCACK